MSQQSIRDRLRGRGGDLHRSSRFRDYSGRKLDPAGWLFLPLALGTTIAFKCFGYRPTMPWLGFRAIRAISRILTPNSVVLEFGAGMSTLWLAARCKKVFSIETNPVWHVKCRELLAQHDIQNVDLRLLAVDGHYPDLDDLPDHSFDFVLVDGVNRWSEAQTALQKTRRGGYVFLDNSDVPDREHQAAKNLLIESSSKNQVRIFTDFYPTYTGANQGILVRLAVS